jgi:hypothetical protein
VDQCQALPLLLLLLLLLRQRLVPALSCTERVLPDWYASAAYLLCLLQLPSQRLQRLLSLMRPPHWLQQMAPLLLGWAAQTGPLHGCYLLAACSAERACCRLLYAVQLLLLLLLGV